jgi:hypothetical protein
MASFDMALVDELRKRLDATYTEALMALEEAQGDLLRALAAVERMRAERQSAESSGELVGKAIALAKEGKLKGLRVKLGARPVRDLPLPKGVGGAVLGAVLSSLLAQLSVDLVKSGEEEEGTSEVT